MSDDYLRFVNGVQAMRRRVEALTLALGGALGVAADPLPHQLATVRRILSDSHLRHLLSDEVGLGKTIQALMIVNALRWQNPGHRTVVVAPERLRSQWQEEAWIRGHVMAAIPEARTEGEDQVSSLLLLRPLDLLRRGEEGDQPSPLDPEAFDLLILDEPQTMAREVVQSIAATADDFRQVLVLSATPRLAEPFWRETLLRMIEPEAAMDARLRGISVEAALDEREGEALQAAGEDPAGLKRAFLTAAAGRRIIRNSREDWGRYLPRRENREIRIPPLASERRRHEIAAQLLADADPAQDLRQQPWVSARALQRSARGARTVLGALAEKGDDLSALAEAARLAALEDPGDSRLEALLDLLAEQWAEDPDQAFIVVCGDNPTIDLLQVATPRYFPDLAGRISVMRRPGSAEADGVASIREMQETLAPLLAGEHRLLLVGDWIQAGLNLHQAAQGLIFYALPWEIDAVDQLIGRVDRLRPRSEARKGDGRIRIWRLVQEGSQEAAIAEVLARLGVFDAPLPPLPDAEMKTLSCLMALAAASGRPPALPEPLTARGAAGLTSRLAAHDPHGAREADEFWESWRATPLPEPVMLKMSGSPNPIRNAEQALGDWLKTINRSGDFLIRPRRDQADEALRFSTLWYNQQGGGGKAAASPFDLPDVEKSDWMSAHRPFLRRRSWLSWPPRKTVNTDEGEENGRPLHFLDHGDPLHDALTTQYEALARRSYGADRGVCETVVRLPEGHPARACPGPALISLRLLDPFPDEATPPLWSEAAQALLASATTERQRADMSADRRRLRDEILAWRRRARFGVPARLAFAGSWWSGELWAPLPVETIHACLRPLHPGPQDAAEPLCAKGASPIFRVAPLSTIAKERRAHLVRLDREAAVFAEEAQRRLLPEAEAFNALLSSRYRRLTENRARLLERRQADGRETGLKELRQGQIAALERSLTMARLCGEEASLLLRDRPAVSAAEVGSPPISLFMSFAPAG